MRRCFTTLPSRPPELQTSEPTSNLRCTTWPKESLRCRAELWEFSKKAVGHGTSKAFMLPWKPLDKTERVETDPCDKKR